MKVTAIEWDAINRRRFEEQCRATKQEVEDVVLARYHPSRARDQRREDPEEEPRSSIHGQAHSGRCLAVIVAVKPGGVLRPITCWPLSDQHLKKYLLWRRTIRR